MRLQYTIPLVVSLLVGGCLSPFEDRPWLVEEAAIVGLASRPAEARPGEMVSLEALVVGPEGIVASPMTWSFCTVPRTASELGGVSGRCAAGEGLETTANPATLLIDACARFGPNPPPTQGDAPQQRPADPDRSGGYHLPFRAEAQADGLAVSAFGFARIRCDLPGVTRAIFDAYEEQYRLNEHPEIIAAGSAEGLAPGAQRDGPLELEAGERTRLGIQVADGASESYVVYEGGGALVQRQEQLEVRWYVTGGELSAGRTPISDAQAEVDWEAPEEPGPYRAWAVVVDDRGGSDWVSIALDVR